MDYTETGVVVHPLFVQTGEFGIITPSTGIDGIKGLKTNKQLTHQSTYSVNLCTII
jgi:hypothetical protein